jgi:uncharacterized integral membrane protein
LNHLWQRFLLASSLVVGLLIGVGVTVFGYSNLARVDVNWSVFHVSGVPLWAVAVVPLALFLIAGTLYHWADGLHHFSEHMRHRRRVHELEAEVTELRAHLDTMLEMPDHSATRSVERKEPTKSLPPAEELPADFDPLEAEPLPDEPTVPPAPILENGAKKSRSQRNRASLDRDIVEDGKPAEPVASLESEA